MGLGPDQDVFGVKRKLNDPLVQGPLLREQQR
jgi:hypothetical protein